MRSPRRSARTAASVISSTSTERVGCTSCSIADIVRQKESALMRTTVRLLICVLAGATLLAADVYRPVKEIAIGGEGGWDYIAVDAAAHRLYVSHATKIVVADTQSGVIVVDFPDLAGVHGIAIAADLGRGFT